MRLIASDFITHYRPTPCDLRIWLRHRGEPEREASEYEKVLHRLGERHEREHLATLGKHLDLGQLGEEERLQRTSAAIANKVPLLYQPAFRVKSSVGEIDVEIVGMPDFLILDGDGYIIRDAKISRRIDEESHPEILLQVQLYGWLFEKSCAASPKALQILSGVKQIVTIPYDGGVSALSALELLVKVKERGEEAYEPVGWTKCNPCGFSERCWNRAEANGDVALVPDVDQSIARRLREVGVTSCKDLLSKFDAVTLSELKRPFGKSERRVGNIAERILDFAKAMETRQEKILAPPAIPKLENFVMFDLEGMPPHLDELDKIYLWGMQAFGKQPSDFMPAVSGFGPTGDEDAWVAFLKNAKRIFELYGDIPFVHWSSYEKTQVKKYIQRYGDVDDTAARVLENLLDLLTITKASVILPVPSFSLKVIEQHVRYERKQDEYGGQWAMATFIEATETNDNGKREQLMSAIIAYNREDLEATWAVFEWLRSKK